MKICKNACTTRSCKLQQNKKKLTKSFFFFIISFLLLQKTWVKTEDWVKIHIWNALSSWCPVDKGWTVIVTTKMMAMRKQDQVFGLILTVWKVSAHWVKTVLSSMTKDKWTSISHLDFNCESNKESFLCNTSSSNTQTEICSLKIAVWFSNKTGTSLSAQHAEIHENKYYFKSLKDKKCEYTTTQTDRESIIMTWKMR